MSRVRHPAVAGQFYPDDPGELRAMLQEYLEAALAGGPVPRAIIAPHAGYVYSGLVAASVYVCLRPARERIRRVVLVGPAHRVPFRGLALPGVAAFATPLGPVPVDEAAGSRLLELPQVQVLPEAHAREHSLEVQLPFLQVVLEEFAIVPLVVGEARPEEVCEVMDVLWEGDETLIVVSSDLSHFHDYETARRIDGATSQAIEELREEGLRHEQACGCVPIQGLLQLARRHGLEARRVDLRNSGDTAGPRSQVVGYGAYVFT